MQGHSMEWLCMNRRQWSNPLDACPRAGCQGIRGRKLSDGNFLRRILKGVLKQDFSRIRCYARSLKRKPHQSPFGKKQTKRRRQGMRPLFAASHPGGFIQGRLSGTRSVFIASHMDMRFGTQAFLGATLRVVGTDCDGFGGGNRRILCGNLPDGLNRLKAPCAPMHDTGAEQRDQTRFG